MPASWTLKNFTDDVRKNFQNKDILLEGGIMMTDRKKMKSADDLGILVSLLILNDKLYKTEFIDEKTRNKMMAEIHADARGR